LQASALASSASAGRAAADGQPLPLRHAGAAAAAAAAALTVFAVARHEGGYDSETWGPLGVGLVASVFALLCVGRRPQRLLLLGAGSLAAVGGLAAASVAWGGIGQQASRQLDLAVLGALALLAGTLAFGRRPRLAVAAASAGITALAVDVLARVAVAPPAGWFTGRALEGPVGYHNAQGILFAVGTALALGQLESRGPERAAAAAAAASCLAGTLLTQSRGAVAALCVVAFVHVLLRPTPARTLRVAALASGGLVLARRLEHVDASLVERHAAGPALHSYVLATCAFALAAAAVAAMPLRLRRLPRGVRSGLATAIPLAAVAAVLALAPGRVETLAAQLRSDAPPATPAGSTRFTSLSLNGRRDAWRVAAAMIEERPLLGSGAGSFARRWTRERRLTQLYIRQPHSIVLELAAELGAAGLAAWCGFLACVGVAVCRARTAARRSALLALGAFLLEAALDWTWSFPGIVVPVLLVTGAAAGGPSLARTRAGTVAALALAAVAAAAAFALPWAARHELQAAAAARALDGTEAWRRADRARGLAPTDPAPVTFEARLAEAARRYALAARLYAEAASRSQEPWVLEWERARVLRLAHRPAAARAACRLAFSGNPGEPRLHAGPCERVAG
jgi:O-antigen ligase